jgi:hypothetical protein
MSGDPHDVETALWMLAQLDHKSQTSIRRRLSLRLDPLLPPAEARQSELAFLAELLREKNVMAGWSFRYVPRLAYDAARPTESLSGAALVERYGSWTAVCRHADHLVGASVNRLAKHRRHSGAKTRRTYSRKDAVSAVLDCASELQRPPSSSAYRAWRVAAEHRRRGAFTYPSNHVILRLYRDRGGWIAVLEEAGLKEPSKSLRLVAPTKQAASELAATLRSAGFVVAHARNLCWLETTASLVEVERCTSAATTRTPTPADQSGQQAERRAPPGRRTRRASSGSSRTHVLPR